MNGTYDDAPKTVETKADTETNYHITMNPTQIFGSTLKDMMSYVGWLKSNQGINHLADTGGVHGLTVDF